MNRSRTLDDVVSERSKILEMSAHELTSKQTVKLGIRWQELQVEAGEIMDEVSDLEKQWK